MFFGSTGITSISKNFLPATSLAEGCYYSMFYNCASLTTAPELSAKSLTEKCYLAMFAGCSSLTTAPELPAITLTESCYAWMFFNCTSLTTAPNLISKNLVNECYNFIFSYCTSLATIKISYTGEYNDEYFYLWVNSVAKSGTFYYNGDQTAQDFGLPSGWATKRIN